MGSREDERLDFIRNAAWPNEHGDSSVALSYTLSNRVFRYSTFNLGLSEIAKLHTAYLEGNPPGVLLITGQSRVGKSELFKYYASKNPGVKLEDRTTVPILSVKAYSSPTAAIISGSLLHGLKDVKSSFRNEGEMLTRAVEIMDRLRTEIVFIDELQHLLDHKSGSILKITDYIKLLLDESKRPVVLGCLPRGIKIYRSNDQLRGRMRHIVIPPFAMNPQPLWKEFLTLLHSYRKLIKIGCIELGENEIAVRFFYASAGCIGHIDRILRAALEIARASKGSIDIDTLASAFTRARWLECPEDVNPFLCKFETLRFLGNPGEPYEHWDTTA